MVRFEDGYAASYKHGGANVKAFWAVPDTPEARTDLEKLGKCIAKEIY